MSAAGQDLLGLAGRRVAVLGAGQGIGLETVRLLAGAGANVVCVDRDPHLATAVAKEVSGVAVTADITDARELERAFTEATADGPLNGIVDIVAIAKAGPLSAASDADLDERITITTRHVMHVMRLASTFMVDDGSGAIAIVGSMAGVTAIRNQGVYGAAKAATHQLVRVGAVELGAQGITVNAVAPYFTKTPVLLGRLAPESWAKIEQVTPNGRVGVPADVAGVLLFLMSGLSRHISGQIFPIDGGLSATVAHPSVPEFGW
ncbi:SDR family NAD(P)-dependent oxidoreductase [Streptomyces sp. NPDC006602]|uniref:SDR family NAD(P)-dependent oxidoreductase n=1 Tax=Streptomyces sp. NPDC006602 TaxID=3364751 RepID=UPI00367DB392